MVINLTVLIKQHFLLAMQFNRHKTFCEITNYYVENNNQSFNIITITYTKSNNINTKHYIILISR